MRTERRQLGEVADVFVGLPTKQSHLKEYGPSGNVLTVRALREFGIDREQLVHVRLKQHEIAKYRASPGDLVLSARSTSLKMGIIPQDLDGVVINATLMAIRPSSCLEARFLAAYLSHTEGQGAITSVAQSGTGQMNLTVHAMSKLEIPLPPIEVQRQMVQILMAADVAYEAGIEAAHARRQIARRATIDTILTQANT